MKTKIKRLSKRTLAVFLGIIILMSCLVIGQITTVNAARTAYKYRGDMVRWDSDSTMTTSNGGYFSYFSYTSTANASKYFRILDSSGNTLDITVITDGFWSSGGYTATDSTNNIHANGSKQGEAYIWTKTAHTVYVCVYYPNTELNSTDKPEVVAYTSLPSDTPTYYVKNNFHQNSGNSTTFQESALTKTDNNNVCLETTYSATLTLSKASQNYKFQIVKQLGSAYKSSGNVIRKYFGMKNSTISQAYTAYDLYTNNDYCKFASPELDSTTTTFTVVDNPWSDDKVSLQNTYPTVYTVSYTLGTHVNYSSVSGGTQTASGTIKAVTGSNVALNVTYDTNYIYDSSNSSLGGATASNSNQTFTFSNITADKSITINAKSSLTSLSAPSIKLNGSASNLTVNAKKGEKVTLSWSAITNAGSYQIYQGSTLVTTTTSTSYDIEKGYSYSGAYTVVAVPSNTSLYSNSAASNSLTLTVNKVTLTAPTVTPSATEINTGGTVTFTITDPNSTYTLGTGYKYQHSGANNTSYSDVTGLSWTTGTLTTAGDKVYKFKATTLDSDYYTTSSATSVTINVSVPAWHLTGDMVTGQGGSAGWPTSITTYPVNTFVSKNLYYRSVTVTGGSSTDKHYFRLTNQSNQYTVTSGSATDMSTHYDSSTAVTASTTGTNGAMYVTGNGTFKIYVDQTTSGSPKVWVVSNEWSLTTNAYYQTFNLATDTHNTAQAGTTGGTVSGDVEVTKGQSTTLTATAASGYTFDGWYTDTDFAVEHRVSTSASYTFTPSANGDYYALFKENTPAHYNVTVATASNITVTATYNGSTINEGTGTLSVPVGASVTVNYTLDTGCQLDSITPSLSSGKFTMPASNTTVTAVASKINYALNAVKSPNYGDLKFYSNSTCTNEITTAQYNQTFYAKYTPPSAYYSLNSFSISGTGSSKTGTNGNVGTFKMGTAAATVTANLKATTPVFNSYADIEVNAGQSFTVTGVTLSNLTLNSTCTLSSYTFNGTTNNTGAFNAPATPGNYTLTVTASNKPAGINTAATETLNITVRVQYIQNEVTYYVDMHNNAISGTPTLSIVSDDSTTAPIKTDNGGQECTSTLVSTGDNSSTVYKATVNTPVTQSGSGYSNLYIRINATLNETAVAKVETLNTTQISTLLGNSTKEVWLEAANDESLELKTTTATNSLLDPPSGTKRIFVAKPFNWGLNSSSDYNENWNKIALYHWGNYTDMGWTHGLKMDYIGYDTNSSSGYYYYQVDVPSTVNNIIFQGFKTHDGNPLTEHTPAVQTGNIEDIGTTNLFVLSKDGRSYKGTKMTDVNNGIAKTASFTKYYTSVQMNKNETTEVNIKPTTSDPVSYVVGTGTGNNFTADNSTNVITVNSSGKITPVASGTKTVRVYIYGTVGDLVKDHTSGYESTRPDLRYHDVTVTIADPLKFNDFNLMSLASTESTIEIPTVTSGGNTYQPGYFDSINSISAKVSGLVNVAAGSDNGYTGSAVIDIKTKYTSGITSSSPYYNKPIAFTVKYAAPSSVFDSEYNSITVKIASVETKSIPRSEGERFGHDHWNVDGVQNSSITTSKSISNSVETAVSENFTIAGGSTYSAIFASYSYVDVTFVYNYYEYNTRRRVVNRDKNGDRIDADGNKLDDGYPDVYVYKDYYQYDSEYVRNEAQIGSTDWNKPPANYNTVHETEFDLSQPTHVLKTYTVSDYEVRDIIAENVTTSNMLSYANSALKDMPENNYYNYTLTADNIEVTSRTPGTYKAVVTINMTHTPKTYQVKQKTYAETSWTPITGGSAPGGNYYYQEYVELTASSYSNWFNSSSATNSSASTLGATLATGTSYKFRVTDQNTYLVTQTTSQSNKQWERAQATRKSSVAYSGHEISHEPSINDPTKDVEKITNNFYIADFFDPAQVLDPNSDPNGILPDDTEHTGTYIPYDDVKFVGGGVMYYSVNHSTGVPNQNAVDNGFVNADGTADKDALKTFITERIEENKPDSSVTDDEDLANSIAYGTNIEATIYKLYGNSTGLVYRYKPYEAYKRDGSGNLQMAQKLDGNGDPVLDENNDPVYEYTFATKTDTETFRYSNALKAYQYIYASKAENKATNNGRDMRVYAYYIYSYTKYAQDTGLPYTEYQVVISDNYAQAETYWSNPNPNS